MRILGHGVDLASASRLQSSLTREGFADRAFTEGEIAYCRGKVDPFPHFAARFAAKEAYGKAVGLGLGASGRMVEVEVFVNDMGAPGIRLTGKAEEIFRGLGGKDIFLSISHEGDMALASVIVTGA